MQVERDKSLRQLNTFGFDVATEYYIRADTTELIHEAVEWAKVKMLPIFVLGGGSNIVLTKSVSGLVLDIETRGIEIIAETEHYIRITVAAGENWHGLVDHCIDHGYYGIENLSLIPGKTGAAPIQNIGAYGVELSDCFVGLQAVDLRSGESMTLDHNDCQFGYRDSIFKRELRRSLAIKEVTLELQPQFTPQLEYGDIKSRLERENRDASRARDVADVICDIRRSKLPDPSSLGNAGSFFTNPIVEKNQFEALKAEYPSMAGFAIGESHYKVAAGWLVEHCGWKGFRDGAVGVHDQQALVLIHRGGGSGAQVIELAEKIRASVHQAFGITLQTEPLVM